jgi:CubicO group peptidase (beta-lactamase class C family)
MFRRIKFIAQLLLLQLTAKSQQVPFDQLPFSNPLQTGNDSILHEQVKAFFKSSRSPGLVIGVSQNGERKFYSYGFADSATKKAFTSETTFEIGSITKTFTANLLFQLQAQGKMDLSLPLSHYLPPGLNDSILQKINSYQVASHSSGLPRLPANLDKIDAYTLMQPYRFYKREHLYAFIKGMKKINQGTYAYSNLGFGLLSTMAENVTGLSFESLLNNYIFQPLDMANSYVETKKNNTDSATGYFYGKPAEYWQFDCLAGAGAIKSTPNDLLDYLDAHIHSGDKVFSTVVYQVTQPVKPVSENMQIAYGWHTLDDLQHRVYWHNGGTYGFSTFAAFEPTTRTSLVLAANSSGVNKALDKLAVDLLILFMGK